MDSYYSDDVSKSAKRDGDSHLHNDPEKGNGMEWSPLWKPAGAGIGSGNPLRILRSLFSPKPWLQSNNKLHPTAYLDGLRGFAALIVYWHHHELWIHGPSRLGQNAIFENSFGFESKYHFAALPFIRIMFCGGHLAVAVFFVLSGFVLSIKPHRLVESNEMTRLVDYLASAMFRRWIRLFLPVVVTTAFYATTWHIFRPWIADTAPQSNWLSEMLALYREFKNFSFVYKEGGVPWLSYNQHVWSIPAEFRGSMTIFASFVALSRCNLKARIWCELGLVFYFMWIADGWYCAMFMAGMLISHMNHLAGLGKLPTCIAQLRSQKTFISYHLLVISLYLGGVPCENRSVDQLARNRGWYLLSFLKPQAVFDYKWFYLFWAAICLIIAVPHIAWLKRFFETRFCQYLGVVSYALYLVHGPILWTVGDRMYAFFGITGKAHFDHIPGWINKVTLPKVGPLGLELEFLLLQVILLPLTLFFANFVTRVVDVPSVKLAVWLYGNAQPRPLVKKG